METTPVNLAEALASFDEIYSPRMILMFEPAGTVNTGDRHEGTIPDYVETTTGHDM
jgi:hypothetical protein